MSNYETHAMSEFRAAGWVDENDNWNDEIQKLICKHVLRLLEVFAEEGHSGSSAPYTINLFEKLAKFEPIAPLTGDDWEWNQICDDRTNGVSVFQSRRCSRVFKQSDRFDGKPYDIEAVIFWEWVTDSETGEKNKSYYTSKDSFRAIEFPYTPTTEYVYRDSGSE